MTDSGKSLRQSSLFMKIVGWGIIALPLVLIVYPPGFLWGMNSAGLSIYLLAASRLAL